MDKQNTSYNDTMFVIPYFIYFIYLYLKFNCFSFATGLRPIHISQRTTNEKITKSPAKLLWEKYANIKFTFKY